MPAFRVRSRWASALAGAVALSLAWAGAGGAAPSSPVSPPPKVKAGTAPPGGRTLPARAAGEAPAGAATALGFCGGDDWEPEIAADGLGHVYVVWAHFPGNPACDPASGSRRHVYIQVSDDGGRTFGPPAIVAPTPGGVDYPNQVDATVAVSDTGAVYVCFLAFGLSTPRTDVACARSTDFGRTFPVVRIINGPGCTNCDHPWPVARGDNVYVMYGEGKNHWLARSSDAGRTWTETLVLQAGSVAFAEGAVVDAAGNAWFAWGDCQGSCTGKTAAVYRVSRTLAGTSSTSFAEVATAPAGPKCPHDPNCGFAYFGPQNDIAIDGAGNLYMVWQDGQEHTTPGSPPIVQLSRCRAGRDCTRAGSWTFVGRADDKTASGCPRSACYALFPRVEGGAGTRIGVIWMDDRNGTPLDHENGWNVWYRTSDDGGTTWSGPSVRVSAPDPARPESEPHGFLFPYGDYQGIDITPTGRAVLVWGEGHDWLGGPDHPGHIVYARIRT